jgi:signal transduction histidine kinase
LARAHNAWVAVDRRGRAEATARLASDERLAIARDLHDAVAHSISVINVQANTALHLIDRQPERAHEAGHRQAQGTAARSSITGRCEAARAPGKRARPTRSRRKPRCTGKAYSAIEAMPESPQ